MTPTHHHKGKNGPSVDEQTHSARGGEIRLSPPPSIGSARQPLDPARIEDGSGGWPWGTILVLLLLAVAAAAVFVGLPRWVASHESAPSASAPVSSPATPQVATPVTPPAASLAPASAPAAHPDSRGPDVEISPEPAPSPRPQKAAKRPTPDPQAAIKAAMTRGLAALDRGEYGKARDAFQEVLVARPDSAEGREGLALAEERLRREHVARYREAALAQEKKEAWGDVARSYEAILAVDPALVFARDGLERALEREKLGTRLRYHLGHPDRLSFEEVLEEVDQLLVDASSFVPRGPALEGQIQSLQRLASAFRRTVPVTLASDGLTDVMLHRVGRQGRFLRKELALRPGVYTLVGSRDGYRDERLKLRVAPEAESVSVEILCREAF